MKDVKMPFDFLDGKTQIRLLKNIETQNCLRPQK